MNHPNCNCYIGKEITCTTCDCDYNGVAGLPKKEPIHVPPRNDEERKKLEEYNKKMKKYCPDFEPWPLTEEEYKQMIHEKAIGLAGGIENLNWAKVLVGEMTPEEAEEDIRKHYEDGVE